MMKFLKLGMTLDQVVAACTATPSRQMGMGGALGTLAPGALADVATFRHEQGKSVRARDDLGHSIELNDGLIPQMTILDGKIAYRLIHFQ